MGKPTGFIQYERKNNKGSEPLERIKNFNEFHVPMSFDERKQQAARCMDCGVPFCQNGKPIMGMVSGCPLNNLIPEWNDLIFTGEMDAAAHRLLLTNNFPEFTSRVCPALCEAACTCGLNGDAVSVKENENSIIEHAFESGMMTPKPPKTRTGKKVAVVGAGPAGLATAAQLNMRGHKVTVFEKDDRAGGLLMYGIPNMKLEKHIIDRRIKLMEQEGIEFRYNCDIGGNISAQEIKDEYDAVVLCCGANNPRNIEANGRDANGIYFAVDFLKATTKSLLDSGLKDGNYISAKDKDVVVIGGGDTGNDCVGTCIRHGCKSVVQLEMMPKAPDTRAENNPWPEWPKVCKTDYGQQEAIAMFGHDPRIYKTTVKEFCKDENGNLKGVVTIDLAFEYDKETKRNVMRQIEGSEKFIDAQLCLIAAGFLGTKEYVPQAFGVSTNARTNVATENGKYSTDVEKVFTAGDMHRGQSLVVWAIREGRDAAREIDQYLMGYTSLK